MIAGEVIARYSEGAISITGWGTFAYLAMVIGLAMAIRSR